MIINVADDYRLKIQKVTNDSIFANAMMLSIWYLLCSVFGFVV